MGPYVFQTLGFVGLQTRRLSFTSRSESMEQATVTTKEEYAIIDDRATVTNSKRILCIDENN